MGSLPSSATDIGRRRVRPRRRLGCLILAAGAGNRLRPLTTHCPKPLLPVLDMPIMARTMHHLDTLGETDIYVNLFYKAELLAAFFDDCPGRRVSYRIESGLSGPAGAVRLFRDCWDKYDAVVVVSGDVVFDGALQDLVDFHFTHRAVMTFAARRVRQASRFGVLFADESGRIRGTAEKPAVPDHEEHLVSAGIYCLDPAAAAGIPERVTYDYAAHLAPDLISSGERVFAMPLTGYWNDIGTLESLRAVNLRYATVTQPYGGDARAHGSARLHGAVHVGPGARIGPGTEIHGPCVVSAGARIGRGCWISRSVLLPGAILPDGTVLADGLVSRDLAA